MIETTIFDFMYPKYKIKTPIRLIELFGGYGSQALALKYLGANFEHWKLVEWAVKSIQAYKDIHFPNVEYEDLYMTKEQMVDFLFDKGISSNYNEPMTKKQISKLSEEKLETIIKNIFITHNLVNIQQVKGEDLEIKDTDKYTYIMTYSFPCQDLSLAGKGKGMSDTSTRSGMLWEVERILSELKEKPQVLLMENVPQVHGADNTEDFNKWQLRLEELGYKNYWQDLIATDYGIPQTRNRCFMVSILGDYSYTFPVKQELKLKLKDLLEKNVPEKYYLSDKMKQYIFSKDDKYKVNENSLKLNRDIACSKTTREGWTRADTSDYITDDIAENYKLFQVGQLYGTNKEPNPQDGRIYDSNGSIPTMMSGGQKVPKIVIRKYGLFDKKNKVHQAGSIYDENGMSPTIDTGTGGYRQPMIEQNDLRIRKLTPKECFRLMGVKDEDFEKVAQNQSDSSLYHLAGDSLITTIMMALFSQMLDINWEKYFDSKEWWNNE